MNDENNHVRIRNGRGSPDKMIDGSLSITSTPGVGTIAVVTTQKEV